MCGWVCMCAWVCMWMCGCARARGIRESPTFCWSPPACMHACVCVHALTHLEEASGAWTEGRARNLPLQPLPSDPHAQTSKQAEKEERLKKGKGNGSAVLPTLLYFDESPRIDGLGLPAPLSSHASSRAPTTGGARGGGGRKLATASGSIGQACDLAVGGMTLSKGSGADMCNVEQADADLLGRAGTRKLRRDGGEARLRSTSSPTALSPSKPATAPAASSSPASPSSSPSTVEKCSLMARDAIRRVEAGGVGWGGGGGGGGGDGGAGAKQLPVVRKMLPVSPEGSFISSLGRGKVNGMATGVNMTTGIVDAKGSGLTAAVTATAASLTPHASGAESAAVEREGAGGHGAGGPVGRDARDMVQRALNGNGALFKALAFGDARSSGKTNSAGSTARREPSWAGPGRTSKEVTNLRHKDTERASKAKAKNGASELGDDGARPQKAPDAGHSDTLEIEETKRTHSKRTHSKGTHSDTLEIEETISFLLGKGSCGALKISRAESSERTLAAARQTLEAARPLHDERRAASCSRQDAAQRPLRTRSEDVSVGARPLTANLEMARKAEDALRQAGLHSQERRGEEVSGAPRQPGAPVRMSLDSARFARDAQLALIPLSHVPHDFLVAPHADNEGGGAKRRLHAHAQASKGRLRVRTQQQPGQQQQQQQQQQAGMWCGRGEGPLGAQLGALVPRPPASKDSAASKDAGGRGGHDSVHLLLHRVSKTRVPTDATQRPLVAGDNSDLRIVCSSESTTGVHADSHTGRVDGGSMGGGGAGLGAQPRRESGYAAGAIAGAELDLATKLRVLPDKLRVLPDIAFHAPGAPPQQAVPPGGAGAGGGRGGSAPRPGIRASLPR